MNPFKYPTTWAVCGLVGAVATASAAPLEPSHIPKKAKWVAHLDYEALAETGLVDKLREKRPEKMRGVDQWLIKQYGIDPQQDLKGATLYGESYDREECVAVVSASYDPSKVASTLRSKPDAKTKEWEGHTLYTYRCEAAEHHADSKHHAVSKRDGDHKGDGDHEGKADHKGKADHQRDDDHHRQSGRDAKRWMVTAVLFNDETIVFAKGAKQAKSAVRLLQGETSSLEGEESDLADDAPEGAVLYASAIDLQKITKKEGVFPVLRQHERLVYATGEHDGKAFENLKLVAESEDVAKRVETSLEGVAAFMKLWAGDNGALEKVADEVEITRDGRVVESHYRGEGEDLVQAFDALKDRFKAWNDRKKKSS